MPGEPHLFAWSSVGCGIGWEMRFGRENVVSQGNVGPSLGPKALYVQIKRYFAWTAGHKFLIMCQRARENVMEFTS